MKKGMTVMMVFLLMAGTLLFGCATVKKDATAPATIGDLNRMSSAWNKELKETSIRLGAKIDDLATKVGKPAGKIAEVVAAPKKEGAAPVAEEPTKEAKEVATPAAKKLSPEAIADLQKRVGILEIKNGNMGKKVTDVSRDVGSLKNKVAGIKFRVIRVNKELGALFELTGKSGENYYFIDPFISGKAEFTPTAKRKLSALVAKMKKEGKVATRITGFGDPTPFKAAKNAAENEAMNKDVAQKRAEKTKTALGEFGKNAQTIGHGKTAQFGDYFANRCALVIFAPAPAPQPTPPPPAPTK